MPLKRIGIIGAVAFVEFQGKGGGVAIAGGSGAGAGAGTESNGGM